MSKLEVKTDWVADWIPVAVFFQRDSKISQIL